MIRVGIKKRGHTPRECGRLPPGTGLWSSPPASPSGYRETISTVISSPPREKKSTKSARGSGLKAQTPPANTRFQQSLPVPAVDRDLRQAEHVDYIGVAHLIADGKGNQVKVPGRGLDSPGPRGELRAVMAASISPQGAKTRLTPDPVHLVHHAVKNAHPQIGHAQRMYPEAKRQSARPLDPEVSPPGCTPRRYSGQVFVDRG